MLPVSEGTTVTADIAFYDFFLLSDYKVIEHWDTSEAIAPQSSWKNDNGKF
ncbi:hypothetical protein [Candidatus Litorirhabdus singularis]|uniref:hypothetical protein n=1 Tax=Candidatus Litorirhabdus singularis TaxID=2518993 RepID=UPI00242C6758|nr:hypothetical protein [Candidatus Litorirhabdus singularis]